jgi:nitroreductase
MTTNISEVQKSISDAFAWRAAVKSFDPERAVPSELLESILEAGRMSATAFGLQPFRLVEVKSADLREKLLEVSYGQRQVVDAPHLFVICAITNLDEKYVRTYVENIAKTRGVQVEDLKGFEDSMLGGISNMSDEQKVSWSARQSYIALGAMLETAALLEVDAGPMEGFMPQKVDEVLELADHNLKSVAYITFGYRKDDKYSQMKKVRLPKEEFVLSV